MLTIPDFSSVPLERAHFGATDIFLCVDVETDIVASLSREFFSEGIPHLLPLRVSELWVVELNMDP